MKRRDFLKSSAKGAAIAAVGTAGGGSLLSACNSKSSRMDIGAIIPLPVQVVIDDVGWWSGKDGSADQEPYRTGINRNHVPADYQAIVNLGKALGIRPQTAMMLCEWDRENILKDIPHCTWMGKNWNNSKWVGPWLEEAAGIINSNKENFEITMHGLAHEWWTDGVASRAEWADDDGIMRPRWLVERHIEAFAEIMRQNNLGELPKTFVPTNFAHSFGVTAGNEVSMAQVIKEHGFTYINTPFNYNFHNIEKVQYGIFGVDSGVLTVDRGTDLLDWNDCSKIPEGEITGSTCGMHWANLLHDNPERNQEIVDGWIAILTPYRDKQENMLAKNSYEFQQQLVHHKLTKIDVAKDEIHLDFSETRAAGTIIPNKELTIKLDTGSELNFSSDDVVIESVSSGKTDESILYTLKVKSGDVSRAIISYEEV